MENTVRQEENKMHNGQEKQEDKLPFLYLMTCKSASIFILTKWSSATWFWQTPALPRLHGRPNSCSISCSCAENYRAGGTEPEEALALCRVHWQTAKMASAVLDFAIFPKQSKLRTGTAIKVEELVSSEHSHGGGTGAEPSIQGISSGSLFQAWRYSERICSSLKWLHGWPTSMNSPERWRKVNDLFYLGFPFTILGNSFWMYISKRCLFVFSSFCNSFKS